MRSFAGRDRLRLDLLADFLETVSFLGFMPLSITGPADLPGSVGKPIAVPLRRQWQWFSFPLESFGVEMIRNLLALAEISLVALMLIATPTILYGQDRPSTDALSNPGIKTAQDEDTVVKPAEVPADGRSQDSPQAVSLEDLPPEFVKAMNAAAEKFDKLSTELSQTLVQMRTTHTLYMNDEDRTPQAADAYRAQRNAARRLMNETFDAALDLIRYRGDKEAATYLVTLIEHRFGRDIYVESTVEAGARLIDEGVRLRYVFLATGRSAISVGNFEVAKKIYDAIEYDELEDVDKTLMSRVELIEEQWKKEQELIEKEKEENRLPRVKLVTTRGEILVELYIDQAPSTVANFIQLVEDGYYDGLDFYQVVDHLLALTGDDSGDGSGSTGKFLKDEHGREDARAPLCGSLVMAKIPLGDAGKFVPNTASAQFAILYLPIPSVTEEQTVFGRVIEGMDVVGSLRRVDPNKKKKKGEVLMPPDRILSAEVVRRPEELPEIIYVDPTKNPPLPPLQPASQ